ncbi:MAG: hypothetical protein ACTSX7_17345 [Alphaproteobacteria bacterium]
MFKKISLVLAFVLVLTLLVPSFAQPQAPVAAQEDNWCSGVDIVFFPGGTPGGPFETVVHNGAVQAAADLGVNMDIVWSDWDPETMVRQFVDAVATSLMASRSWAILAKMRSRP